MTEYPDGQTPTSPSAPAGWPSASAPVPYPPPPEYYEQAPRRAPAPTYPPGYGPYGAYPPPQAYPPPAQAYAPYPPQPVVPARDDDDRARLFWPVVSAVASFAIYAVAFGWQFGLGFMALLLVHEMGHYIVIRSKGLPAGLPIFIPLLGAFVTMRRAPATVRDEAEIAIAGPLAGAIGGVVCLIAYWQAGMPVLLLLAYYSFLLNLLNLIPVGPLDGARIVGAISKWIWPIGLLAVGAAAYYTHNTLLIVLGAFGAFQLFSRFSAAGSSRYYSISLGSRAAITLLYVALSGVLAYATYALHPLIGTGIF